MKTISVFLLVVCLNRLTAQELVTLTDSDKQLILDLHNKARAVVKQSPLTWNNKLAQVAAKWAKECKWQHSLGAHGENLAASWPRNDVTSSIIHMAMDGWNGEKTFSDTEGNWECMRRHEKGCGHYTQVVWWETKEVGCSIIRCSNLPNFVVCEYDPPGNWLGEAPY